MVNLEPIWEISSQRRLAQSNLDTVLEHKKFETSGSPWVSKDDLFAIEKKYSARIAEKRNQVADLVDRERKIIFSVIERDENWYESLKFFEHVSKFCCVEFEYFADRYEPRTVNRAVPDLLMSISDNVSYQVIQENLVDGEEGIVFYPNVSTRGISRIEVLGLCSRVLPWAFQCDFLLSPESKRGVRFVNHRYAPPGSFDYVYGDIYILSDGGFLIERRGAYLNGERQEQLITLEEVSSITDAVDWVFDSCR